MCRGCATDCELSYPAVYRFIRQNEGKPLSMDDIANGAGVSRCFVKGLILEGKFENLTGSDMPDLEAVRRENRKALLRNTSNTSQVADKQPVKATAMTQRVQSSKTRKNQYGLGR